jgi:CheY-like chemotaxis protein
MAAVEEAKAMARLLVVDDEAPVRNMLVTLLSDRGHAVEAAENGRDALALAESGSFNCIFLDINMPVMNGIETLKELLRRNPKTVVIMVSGAADEEQAKQALELGAADYIEKPFDTTYLNKVLLLNLATAG